MTTLRFSLAPLLVLGMTAVLAGCTTTSQVTAEWRDPTFAAGSLNGRRLLVVCRAPDDAIRRLCEDQWVQLLGSQGSTTVPSYEIAGFPWTSADASAEMMSALRTSGVSALVSMAIGSNNLTLVNQGAQVGVGIGGGSGGGHRGGGFSFGGFGISFPIGSGTATHGLTANSSMLDVASGKVIWSGSASAPATTGIRAQVSALAQVTSEAMRRAGLF